MTSVEGEVNLDGLGRVTLQLKGKLAAKNGLTGSLSVTPTGCPKVTKMDLFSALHGDASDKWAIGWEFFAQGIVSGMYKWVLLKLHDSGNLGIGLQIVDGKDWDNAKSSGLGTGFDAIAEWRELGWFGICSMGYGARFKGLL